VYKVLHGASYRCISEGKVKDKKSEERVGSSVLQRPVILHTTGHTAEGTA
jgi:hypothetical protein